MIKLIDNQLSSNFTLINWNVSNPSLNRAIKQVKWLVNKEPDIIALTETKFSKGCKYIQDRLKGLGYQVLFPKPEENGYGVLLAGKLKMTDSEFDSYINLFPARIISTNIIFQNKEMEFIVTYIPNSRNEKKKKFLEQLLNAFQASPRSVNRIFCGDFNVLEPKHIPQYKKFEDWEYSFYEELMHYNLSDCFRHLHPENKEYSWVGRTGDGYRYDHCFASRKLLSKVDECCYLHETREQKLSDHSAMVIKLNKL